MYIHTITNQLVQENTYILENDQACLVVDPGSDSERIIAKLIEIKKPLVAILLTHTHFDHIAGLDTVRDSFNHPPVYVSEKESEWLASPKDNLSEFATSKPIIAKPADHFFRTDITYDCSGFHFRVLETPGHSIGGVSLSFDTEKIVLSGDALFHESVGRSDLPTGNYNQLITSIKERLLTLSDDVVVYPGHGPSTTIAHEKTFNPHLASL